MTTFQWFINLSALFFWVFIWCLVAGYIGMNLGKFIKENDSENEC